MNELANQQSVDGGLRELALFAGAGGGILGGKLLGWRTVCAVEIEPYPASVLVARQNDGILAHFPIWDDIRTFDGKPWRGLVDVVSGGFPCQDISIAGSGKGIQGERSGLWKEMSRVVCEVRPRYVFVENSPMLTIRGLGTVLGDLAAMGFDAKWGVLGGIDTDAPHKRERIWILADSHPKRISRPITHKRVSEATQSAGKLLWMFSEEGMRRGLEAWDSEGRPRGYAESALRRSNDGLAGWDDRLKAIGNGQISAVAKLAWQTLGE